MLQVETKYGRLHGVIEEEFHSKGNLKRCVVKEKNILSLPFGNFIPQYIDDGKRKKLLKSMTFYENGNLETLILQEAVPVQTNAGLVPAEMITFYENGAIKRIFPSFGTITGFWTEMDEYKFSPELSLGLPFCRYFGKLINLMFYSTGELRSMTLWPRDSITLQTPAGKIKTRIGIRFFKSGRIQSLEPKEVTEIETPIGKIPTFDPDAVGIDGDKNSLVFKEDGSIDSMLTSNASITAMQGNSVVHIHSPKEKQSEYFDNMLALEPMKISFDGQKVIFGKRKERCYDEYAISDYTFLIEPLKTDHYRNTCEECCG